MKRNSYDYLCETADRSCHAFTSTIGVLNASCIKRMCACVALTVVVCSGILAAAIISVYVEIPQVDNTTVNLSSESSVSAITINTNPIAIGISLLVQTWITSRSYAPISLKNSSIVVTLPLDDGSEYELTRVGNQDIIIAPRQQTVISVPVQIDVSDPLNNAATQKLVGACGILSGTSSPIDFNYQIFGDIMMFHELKLQEGTFTFNCGDNDYVKSITAAVQAGKSILEKIPTPVIQGGTAGVQAIPQPVVDKVIESAPEVGNQVINGAGSILNDLNVNPGSIGNAFGF